MYFYVIVTINLFSHIFPQHLCWGSPFLPSLSVSCLDCWKRSFPTPLGHQDVIIVVIIIVVPPVFIYQKVIYNIGTEIQMLQCNLHNSTQEAPTELSFSGIYTKFRDENNGIGPSAVATT